MTLKTRIQDDMKDAMRAKAAARLSTIRLLLAAIKQREVDERREMTDADVLSVVDKAASERVYTQTRALHPATTRDRNATFAARTRSNGGSSDVLTITTHFFKPSGPSA